MNNETTKRYFEIKRLNVRLDQLYNIVKSLSEKVRILEAKNLPVPALVQDVSTGVSVPLPEQKP